MKYAWDLPNSSLHEVHEDGSRGAEVGHCERLGNRHREDGWVAFVGEFRILNGQWWIFPDEAMAKQAVLDAVEGKTMICNLTKYLMEQETSCREMAITANLDTPVSFEWRKAAEGLHAIRRQHVERCPKCQWNQEGLRK